MRVLLVLIALALVAGCATNQTAEQAYYQAAAAQQGRPMVELIAEPGQAITGLQSLTIYAPTQGGVQQYRKQYHPAWSILGSTLQIGLPVYLGGKAAVDLVDAVGKRVGDVARDVTVVEQPAPTIVTQPAPTVVDPVIVPPADPVIVPPADPIIIEQPAPIIVDQPVLVPTGE